MRECVGERAAAIGEKGGGGSSRAGEAHHPLEER